VRDTAVLREYGFPVFSHSTTPRQGPHVHQPWACNVLISCGGVAVRPGDAIVGDQDGVIVVPASHAKEVYDIAHSREVIEDIVKEELTNNPGPPGKFYPFMSGKIKAESPLGKLLTSKGVKFAHTAARPGARGGIAGAVPARARVGAGAPRNASSFARTHAEYAHVLKEFAEHKACAVLRTPIVGACTPAMTAAVDGGFKLIEFTLTTPGCLDSVATFANRTDVIMGVGTVMTIQDAKDAMEAGAKFIVSPVLVPEVVQWCAENNIVCAPGCGTPSEMYQAFQYGAPIQKLFPGVAGGPNWVKAVSAALPMLRINPTSGVEVDTAADYLRAGASSLGFVAPAFPPALVAAQDWNGISEIARKIQAAVKAV
jgi:Entner-Doudoroff aldolase